MGTWWLVHNRKFIVIFPTVSLIWLINYFFFVSYHNSRITSALLPFECKKNEIHIYDIFCVWACRSDYSVWWKLCAQYSNGGHHTHCEWKQCNIVTHIMAAYREVYNTFIYTNYISLALMLLIYKGNISAT